MKLNDHTILWNYATIRIMDVRHTSLEQGEVLSSYQLPASAFLYVTRGSGRIRLNGAESAVRPFQLMHGGKGLCLDLMAEELLNYYLILYKAAMPLTSRRELLALWEAVDNPFQLQFSFAPHDPIAMLDKAQAMYKAWERTDELEKLHVKSLFYQFVHELLRQLASQSVQAQRPDLVAQAIRYIHEHYKEPITLESLADMLDCNPRQFLRMFRNSRQTSPIDYLIQVRMDKAKELLLNTECTMKQISESVGYSDSYYFSRMFKKCTGVSPTAFKETAQAASSSRNNPSAVSTYPIAAIRLQQYSDYDNHYHYIGKGDLPVLRRTRASFAASLLFCMILLLSSCAVGTSSTDPGAAGATKSGATATAPAGAGSTEADSPRIIKHAMGEETVKGTPKRVVILTNEGTEALLAVGVKPIGAVQSWIGNPWYDHIKNEMNDVAVVGDELQPNIELITNLKPDLIIGNKARQEKIYGQLKQIAPTVFAEDLGGDWKINFKLYMDAINKKEEGDKAMAVFDKRVADVKAKLGSKAATKVSVARFSASQVRIYQKQTFSGVLLSQLGFARPASQDKDSFIEVMSKEKIPSMDGDVLFYFVTETAGKTGAAKVVQEWMNDPLFKNLNVAKTNKVVQVDEAIWNSAGGYKAANLLLDELVKYFEIK
ncbi:AraC family transcriptional regulator [Paenibacillus sp. MZ04-78.2]|uniref:ABC transporter substrate-binding protein n=1 Tax=Paenibacillus sp. MZ04-78.2 TaxID=2962034 RepID=UPI0020B8E06B|nr:ABC transporter substrate-binding protein [Paenibacillus sp. MZ04-78.2]MCP3776450.1 AraC family transcriptional regulator [Paenibacillus sp. MZ04-78.2]